jgi:hypothetical protein
VINKVRFTLLLGIIISPTRDLRFSEFIFASILYKSLSIDLIYSSSISSKISLRIFIGFIFLNGLSSSAVFIHSKFIGLVIQ